MRFTRFFIALLLPLAMVSCAEEDLPEAETDPRIKFTGNWTVSEETAGVATGTYPSTIILDTANTTQIVIGNIFNLGSTAKIKSLVAGNTLDISAQTIAGISIAGTGTFAGNSFVLNYTANDGSTTESVKATYSK